METNEASSLLVCLAHLSLVHLEEQRPKFLQLALIIGIFPCILHVLPALLRAQLLGQFLPRPVSALAVVVQAVRMLVPLPEVLLEVLQVLRLSLAWFGFAYDEEGVGVETKRREKLNDERRFVQNFQPRRHQLRQAETRCTEMIQSHLARLGTLVVVTTLQTPTVPCLQRYPRYQCTAIRHNLHMDSQTKLDSTKTQLTSKISTSKSTSKAISKWGNNINSNLNISSTIPRKI